MPLALYWLALGAFCVGTETFIIAPLLPAVAAELGVSIATAGHLVTTYALTYAIGSPVLSTLLGAYSRKPLLVASLAAFALANVFAVMAQSFAQLVAAQVLLALAAGIFMPAANAVAAMIVPPEKRGRAISIVIGGLSVSLAFGVPIGSLIGAFAHWRMSFVLIAVIGALGTIGLLLGLPRNLPGGTATLAERIRVARRPAVLLALCVTLLWSSGIFAFYTFVAPFLTKAIQLDAGLVPLVLFVFGVAGWVGTLVGGWLTDRNGPVRTLGLALLTLASVYVVFGLAARIAPSAAATAIISLAFIVGGIAGWTFHPSQTSRLVQLAPDSAIVALSLNQSALYFGSAAGAALGAFTVSHATVFELPWVSALAQLAAASVLALALRVARSRPVALQPGE
jgi:predicted MFS family arabinose efflux permease